MKLKIKKRVFNDIYYPSLWDNTRYLHYWGGSGSGKSVFVAQKLILESFKREHDTLVLRKVEKTIKESTYKLIKSVIYQWKLQEYFSFNIAPAVITNLVTGHRFVFSGLDDPEKIKSIAGIQKIWVEEATELRLNDFLELDRRLRGLKNHQIIFSYNPIDENHWLKIQFHNKTPDNCKIIKSTYLDNKFIDEEYKATLDRMKSIDENQWRIYALGEWGILNLAHKFDIKRILQCKPQEPLEIIDGVKIYQKPEPGQIYSIGIDPSSGLGSDWSCLSMRNFYTGKLVAQLKGKVREREMARIAVNLANWYNNAGSKVYIACEVNGLGRAVQNMIQDTYPEQLLYKRYIQDPTKQYDTLIPDFGFQTTTKNRDLIINNFVYAFADDKVDMINQDEIDEAKTFIWNTERNRYEAQEGGNDDLLFSDFICYDNFNYIRQYG